MLDAYDSNSFQRLIYPLNKDIRDKSLSDITASFDSLLIRSLVDEEVLQLGQCTTASDIFTFERFKGAHNRWTNFSKYVLMRIDRWLSHRLDKPCYASESLNLLEDRFNKNNAKRMGMHLEHILTQHPANRSLFKNREGALDESEFQRTRNLLGMVLLLTDKQNLSSNDDLYEDKQETYRKSNLIWNELMVGHVDPILLGKLDSDLLFPPILPVNRLFPVNQVENRQKAFYAAVRSIWGAV